MIRAPSLSQRQQRGMVLITSLLLLVVVTMLAVSMFRSFGISEKIAGNIRDKQRATTAAESAEQYAEWWLVQGNNTTGTACTTLAQASLVGGVVCSNPISAATLAASVPWTVGVVYQPPSMNVQTGKNVAMGTYYFKPTFYINYLGIAPGSSANNSIGYVYQIDAVAYGGTADTISVVESTYVVQSSTRSLDP